MQARHKRVESEANQANMLVNKILGFEAINMAIPDYQTVMLPLLRLMSDGKERQIRDAVNTLTDRFKLTEVERKETLPRGKRIFVDRVGWARSYLKKAGLLNYPSGAVSR